MRMWRNRVQLVPAGLLAVVMLLAWPATVSDSVGTPAGEGFPSLEPCRTWVCPGIQDGTLPEWLAWVYWCDCSVIQTAAATPCVVRLGR